MATAADIVVKAREYLGTPWQHQGRRKGLGVDCAGLIICVAHELGLSEFDVTDYGRTPNPQRMGELLDAHMDRVFVSQAEPGDVLWMAFDADPQHLAIVTDIGIIHALSNLSGGISRVAEHRLNYTWRQRIRRAYRYRGIQWN